MAKPSGNFSLTGGSPLTQDWSYTGDVDYKTGITFGEVVCKNWTGS